jgi:hypothetical protein
MIVKPLDMGRSPCGHPMARGSFFALALQSVYILVMEKVSYTGIVMRLEPDGFGIIKFDAPLGPSENAFGVISSSGTLVSTSVDGKYRELKSGMRVEGTANVDDKELAAVQTVVLRRP